MSPGETGLGHECVLCLYVCVHMAEPVGRQEMVRCLHLLHAVPYAARPDSERHGMAAGRGGAGSTSGQQSCTGGRWTLASHFLTKRLFFARVLQQFIETGPEQARMQALWKGVRSLYVVEARVSREL